MKTSGDRALTLDDFRTGTDRRSEPRITRQRQIDILPCTAHRKWEFKVVTLFDCSPHGIGIVSDLAMKRNDEFLAKVKVGRTTMVIYRVCHCEETSPGQFKIGAKLVEFVGTPDEILQALLRGEEA
jgi:hypothetical protein